jgi:hypothetical protein
MTPVEFRNLRLEAAYLLGAADPQAFAESGELDEGGVHLGLFRGEDGLCVHCYADLGHVGDDVRAQVFEELLALNLAAAKRAPVVFGFDRDSGHAIVNSRVAAKSLMSGAALAAHIARLRQAALDLRRRLPDCAATAAGTAIHFQLA